MAAQDSYASRLMTEEGAKAFAKELANWGKAHGKPADFEVVRLARPTVDGNRFEVQPAGMHVFFKTHKLCAFVRAD